MRVASFNVLHGRSLADGRADAARLAAACAWQLRRVVRALRALPGPYLLLGDFNLPRPMPPLLSGLRPLVTAATFPVARPRLQLDHVLASPGLPVSSGGRGVALPVSDHRAVVVEVG